MLALANYRSPDAPVLLGPGMEISAALFFSQVRKIAKALPGRSHVINLCESRHGFMLGFAAALLRGQTSLLPSGRGRSDWEPLLQLYPGAYLLVELPPGAPIGAAMPPAEHPVFDVRKYMKAKPAAKRGTTVPQCPQVDRDHQAAILFTSGSTGQPTAHGKTWGQLCQGAAGLARALGWPEFPACAVLGSVPPQHMFGLEATVMLPWFTGVPVHTQIPLLPGDLATALRQSARPVWWMTTPLHLRAPLLVKTTLPAMTGILTSTMSLPAPLANAAEAAWQVPVMEIYGSTETGAIASRRTALETLWRPLPGVSLSTGDAGGGKEGRPTWVCGAHISPPVLLGDELDIQADGRFLWRGRASDMIKVGGKRASLAALNQHLTEIPGVEDGACFFPEIAAANAADGRQPPQRLAVLYVSSTLSPQEVLNTLRTRIDAVFLPRPIFRVAQLPRNANGKLPAAALAELFAGCKSNLHAEAPAPRGPHYRTVPDAHPCVPGHFPGNPLVPGALILAQVAEAIVSHFPHRELGVLLNARFHAPLKPGERFLVRPQLLREAVHFEVEVAAASGPGEVIASGRWALGAAIHIEENRR